MIVAVAGELIVLPQDGESAALSRVAGGDTKWSSDNALLKLETSVATSDTLDAIRIGTEYSKMRAPT